MTREIQDVRDERLEKYVSRARVAAPLAVVLFTIALLAAFFIGWSWQQAANDARGKARTLADEIIAECAAGKIEVGGRDLCAQAEQTRQEVTQNVIGPAGPEGPPGPAGPEGPQGHPGPAGQDGRDGDDGRPAPTPPAGEDGADGRDGTAGQDGKDGAQGPKGEPGERGPQGSPGPAGERGPAGPSGPAGARGPAGATGPSGPPGAPGSPGPAGVSVTAIDCVGPAASSHWEVSYSNGTKEVLGGPCRVPAAEPAPNPTTP